MKKLENLIDFLLPLYVEEGKLGLTIAIGCTGGRHRSAAIAQTLADFIEEQGYAVQCIHRDIQK